jgi:ubiquitin carboxyl-terminal hydrolase 9/24
MSTFKLEFKNLFRHNQWSPPAQSNEASNGYFLERSLSALFLAKSIELCPEEEAEGEETVANEESENTVPTVAEELSSTAKPPGQRTVQARQGHAQPATP